MEEKKKMASLIANYLKGQLGDGTYCEEAMESIEVAVQCIESAFNLSDTDTDNVGITLENIIKDYYQGNGYKVILK